MNVLPCRCTPMIQCRRCRDIEHQVRKDPERAMEYAVTALQERQADDAERFSGKANTQAGQIAAARGPGRVILEWKRAHGYRLRIVPPASETATATAALERQYGGKGPWRRMPYPQVVVDKLAELAAGQQWREMPMEGGS